MTTSHVPYLAGEDVAVDARLQGLMAFHFACYSAGTPQFDNFTHVPESAGDAESALRRRVAAAAGLGGEIAREPFIAALPKKLLSLPGEDAALAVVGHVDRAWTSSFSYLGKARETIVFESILEELLTGGRLGHAMRYMSRRYAELASDIAVVEDPSAPAAALDSKTRARMWRACNDARNYVILGDPAVRLPAAMEHRPR